jgi:protease I
MGVRRLCATLRLNDVYGAAICLNPGADPNKETDDMTERLNGKRIAIIATDMVERAELVEPRAALDEAGARTELISLKPGSIQTVNHHDKADTQPVDVTIDDADPADYDGLLLPGGVANPDVLRTNKDVISFVRDFFAAGKPIAAICHGPWVLVEADVVHDRTLTSWPSLQTDIRNAGGDWVDREVVVDQGLVTSRKPDDIPAFNERMIEEFAEGVHVREKQETGAAR